MNAQTGKFLLQDAKESGALVETRNGVRYFLEENARAVLVLCMWSGKSTKPALYGGVRDYAHALKLVAKAVDDAAVVEALKAQRKEEKAQKARASREALKVGTLLCNSWGYEQTNVDFYEVVSQSASGASVMLRKVASRTVSEGVNTNKTVAPCPGQFVGEAFKKVVGAYGVQFQYGWTSVTKADETHNSTSYH
jgi:hypothetical protein